uniref:RxLR effector candidate protein n=1 Tax=Peronospora matthiolae TaxID=2874970 RepID=A0AAV1TTK4_9STRA
MRISSSALISALVLVAGLTLPPGISAISATEADNLKEENDNHDAGIADKNLRTADTNNSEERVMLFEIFKSVVNSIPVPKLQKLFQSNKAKVTIDEGEFLVKLSGSKLFSSTKAQLRTFMSNHKIDDLANMLQKAKESSDSTISDRAKNLLKGLLEHWATKKKSPDTVLNSLNVFGRPSRPTEDDYRKIKVLHAYIQQLRPGGESYPVLFEALKNRFGHILLGAILARSGKLGDANTLLKLLMDKWKETLSIDNMFSQLLDFDPKIRPVFKSGELLTLERYVKYVNEDMDVLDVLTKGFGGEAQVAKLAYEAQVSTTCLKASKYLRELLLRWMAQGIEPDKLLSTKFPKMLSQEDEQMKKFISDRYSELYESRPDLFNRKLDGPREH